MRERTHFFTILMAEKETNRAVAVQRFRDSFEACLEENRVRPHRSNFYLGWARAFVDFTSFCSIINVACGAGTVFSIP